MSKLLDFINTIIKINPQYLHDLDELGPLVKLGEGSFRRVYTIGNYPIAIKLPKVEKNKICKYSINHSREECRAYRRAKRFASLRPFLPEVYYISEVTGAVVSKLYKLLDSPTASDSEETDRIGQLFCKKLEVKNWDYQDSFLNFGYEIDKNFNKSFKVLDLGTLVYGQE